MTQEFYQENYFMLVKCIGNSARHLSTKREKQAYAQHIHQDEVHLEINKEYQVYGITFRDGNNIPWFLVCEEDDEYPIANLGAFFEIIDNQIPSDWAFTSVSNNAGEVSILPKRWADDPAFLEKLDNEEEDALAYFRQLSRSLNNPDNL